MASSSSSQVKRYHVFPSFHGPDVRRGFLSHLHTLFARKGITTFKDQEIERGHIIGSTLVQAIRESRVLVVLLSKNYASSSWCLDELVEILNCREVMTIFYEVDPSDVRKQRGDFGDTFERTCKGRTEEEKQKWSQALSCVATIAGEHSSNWDDEAAMAEKFVKDVFNKMNDTPSRDFDGMVGMEAHLRQVSSLLCLESNDVMMVGIWGPAGIGKTTIARALYNRLSSEFRLTCFMGNLKDISYKGTMDYELKLYLQKQLLSRILNHGDMVVSHSGSIKEWLQHQRVLIILDDVDDLEKLEALASEHSWFGSGSRIIVTTKDKQILRAHGINSIYLVDFPSTEDALEILCLSAFKQSFVKDGFEEVAYEVAMLCGKLPLALRVVGSSLRGESKHEWELQLSRIKTNLDRKIEDVLVVGYDRLSKKDQSLFLHVACMFNKDHIDHLTTVLADSNLDVENGLKTLAAKSLVDISPSERRWIVMHDLLQQLGRKIVHEQSDEPGKRQFLVEAEEIREVLANETGTGSVLGISLDMFKISSEFYISGRAFEGMRNLQFLKFDWRSSGEHFDAMFFREEIEYMPRLRLLHWESYPGKCLPPKFQPECLVELHMQRSKLERLWTGIQPLGKLKKIDLSDSWNLKEIPDLSKATNLETLTLSWCTSLVEFPSSISNLHKLEYLNASGCTKLQVIPTNINLASLCEVNMGDCWSLRSFPDFSSNISELDVRGTMIEDVPASVVGRWSRLDELFMGSRSLKKLTHVPECLRYLDISNSDIKRIPASVIGMHSLAALSVTKCRKLVSLKSLLPSLYFVDATNCGSLKSVTFEELTDRNCLKLENEVCFSLKYVHDTIVSFKNCLKLDEEARRGIIQRWGYKRVLLPGKVIPADFTHKATRNSITISSGIFSTSSRFKACLLLSSNLLGGDFMRCCIRSKGTTPVTNELTNELKFRGPYYPTTEQHLLVFSGDLFKEDRCLEVDTTTSEIQFEFSCKRLDDKMIDNIMECGVEILEEEAEGSSSSKQKEQNDGAVQIYKDESVVKSNKHTSWLNWLRNLALRKKKKKTVCEFLKNQSTYPDSCPLIETNLVS